MADQEQNEITIGETEAERGYQITTVAPGTETPGKIEFRGQERCALIYLPPVSRTAEMVNQPVALLLYVAEVGRYIPLALSCLGQRQAWEQAERWMRGGIRDADTILTPLAIFPPVHWDGYRFAP